MDIKQVNIFAPNLNNLFETFDNRLGSQIVPVAEEDGYISALLQLGILVKSSDSLYDVGEEWSLMNFSGSRLAAAFRKKMLEMPIIEDIFQLVGDKGMEADDIVKALKESYPKNTVMTLLSWAETLRLLTLNDRKYCCSNDAEDEEEQGEYPSLDEVISIKEEKYSIYEYLRKLNTGSIILSPDFQRHEVWKPEQKSNFIESVLRGLPLPPIYLKKNSESRYIIVDGLQRTSALRDFMNGRLRLSGLEPEGKNVLKGATIDTLDNIRKGLRARIEDRQLFVYVMEPSVPMSVVYDVFSRINTGGTQLSRQEIRNCIFLGQSTNLIGEIAKNQSFKKSVDFGISELRMKDREAVLRCLSFIVLNYELDYDGSMDKFLEKAMGRINRMNEKQVNELKTNALNVFSLTHMIFGDSNFRIPLEHFRGRINIAVMETIFQCFYLKMSNISFESWDKVRVKEAYASLVKSKDYLESVRWTTGATSKVKTRFRLAHNYLDSILNV